MEPIPRRIFFSCGVILLAIGLCLSLLSIGGALLVWHNPSSPQPVEQAPTSNPPATAPPIESTPALTPKPDTDNSNLPGADILAQMKQIESQVITLRGLSAKKPVERALLNNDQLLQHITDSFLKDYSAQDAQNDTLSLAAFGLLDPQFDLYHFYINLYSEQIAGYYDDQDKKMYVVQNAEFTGLERMTYAHEFTHVLQDQYYDLENGLNLNDVACRENSERCAAIQALVEGDASYTEFNWLSDYASDQDRQQILDFYQNYFSPVYDSAPDFMQADFVFPYNFGLTFVESLYNQGGWDAVNQAYQDPPLSTEQILHPERYPSDSPAQVTLPDFSNILGNQWQEIDHGVLGEWYTFLVLAHGNLPVIRQNEKRSQTAAEGWGGDAYVVYYRETDQAIVLALNTVWDTPKEALQFAQTFRDYANARFGSPQKTDTWQTGQEFVTFTIQDAQTIWLITPDQALNQQILPLLQP